MKIGPKDNHAQARLARLWQSVGPVSIDNDAVLAAPRTLVTLTSSRLGRRASHHRTMSRLLNRSMLECRQYDRAVLIAAGSAVEPWARRAAELFDVPLVLLVVDDHPSHHEMSEPTIRVSSTNGEALSRDSVAIALGDRVDGVFVRRQGNIARALDQRLQQYQDATVRVAITDAANCAGRFLVDRGAIGWFCPTSTSQRESERKFDDLASRDRAWVDRDGEWLVHCTRGRSGPWPGETEDQYRDALLLGDSTATDRDALDTLRRILRSGRLIGSNIATQKSTPVVCFSALPLRELLARRCFRPHLGRWDYEPYGIAVRISAAHREGVQPVIYGTSADRTRLSENDQFRFHPTGKTYDWTQEREWRCSNNFEFSNLADHEMRVFVAAAHEIDRIAEFSRWPIAVVG